MQKDKKRLLNADLIRVIAMLMVILLHTILNFTIRPDFFPSKLWFVFEPIVAISKTCVLLFFMLSGYLVIAKKRGVQENINKTIKKIVIPLFFFSLLNTAYDFYHFSQSSNDLHKFALVQVEGWLRFPNSPLWFLVVLCGLYLLNPIWQLVFDKTKEARAARFITLTALIFSLSITILEFPAGKVGLSFNNFTAWTGFAFFYFYGALVKNRWLDVSKQKTNLLLIALGFGLTVAGDYLSMWQQARQIDFTWINYSGQYLSIPVTMMAIGIFNFLISADFSHWPARAGKIITWLSGISFGVYLIHSYVISVFTDILGFNFNKLQINVYLYNLLNIFLVILLSMAVTLLLKKIPKLKAVIGE